MTTSSASHEAQVALGVFGEELAARHVSAIGMRVVDRNWRSRSGELDLVAVDGDELVFCEVKTRSGELYGGPAVAVDRRKLARLRKLAGEWLATHDMRCGGVRIDVIAITCPRGASAVVQHIRGVS